MNICLHSKGNNYLIEDLVYRMEETFASYKSGRWLVSRTTQEINGQVSKDGIQIANKWWENVLLH